MLPILVPLARADLEWDLGLCAPVEVTATVPAPDQGDVPVDVLPAVAFEGCVGGSFQVDLWRDDNPALVVTAYYTHAAEHAVLRLAPPVPLEPGTPYLMRVTPEGGAEIEVRFTTGSGTVLGFEGVPEAEVHNDRATWSADTRVTSAWLTLHPVPDPDGLSLLTVSNERAVNQPLFVGAASPDLLAGVAHEGARVDAQCYTVIQWDGRGEGHATDLPCVDVVAACAAAPGQLTWLAIGAGLLALRRGRR